MRMKFLLAGSAVALGMALAATPASAQVVCDSNVGLIGTASGGPPSFACGFGAVASGNFAVAVGPATIASGLYSTALGNGAYAQGIDALAVGQNAHATTDFATAIGFGSRATQPATTAVGIVAHADGYGSTAIGYYAYATGLNSTAVGRGAYANAQGAIAIGRLSVADGVGSVALGNYADTAGFANSVALGQNTVNTAANQVAVGGRKISGVTAGTISATSTEAINGSQLFATNVNVANLQAADIVLSNRIDRVDKRASGGTAVAIALGGNAFLPDKRVNLTANVGGYRGAIAGAIQLGALVSDSIAFNAGVGSGFNHNGKIGARGGVTFGW